MSVGAVNKQTGDRIPTAGMPAIDNALDLTSVNPVQNAVITAALAGKQATLTFDDVPTDNSNNPVKSNGVYDALATKQNATDNNLDTTAKTIVGAINEHEGDIDSLKSGLNNLDTEVNGDATVYPYADVITIEDAIPANLSDCSVKVEPTQNLHGYDHPWVGGAGKNKLPLVLADIKTMNTAGTWSGNTYSYDGITIACESNQEGYLTKLTVNGTPSSAIAFRLLQKSLDFASGSLASGITGGSWDTYLLEFVSSNYDSRTYVYGSSVELNNTNVWIIEFTLRAGVQFTNVVCQPMIRLATETDATFAPYTNICPITGHTEASVQRDGKNLFDPTQTNALHNKIIEENGDEITNQYWSVSDYVGVKGEIAYSVRYTATNPGASFYVAYYDSGFNFMQRNAVTVAEGLGVKTVHFTTVSGAKYARLLIPKANGSEYYDWSTVSVYEGNEVLTDAYAGQTYTISLGDTIYGGTVDFDSGVMTVTHASVDMGDLTYTYRSDVREGMFVTTGVSDYEFVQNVEAVASAYNYVGTSSSATSAGNMNDGECSFYYLGGNNSRALYFINTNYSDATDFKTAMDGQTVCYKLATPTTIQLTPQQIQLLKGQNTLYASTGQISVTVNGVSGSIGAVQEQVNDIEIRIETAESDIDTLSNNIENLYNKMLLYIAASPQTDGQTYTIDVGSYSFRNMRTGVFVVAGHPNTGLKLVYGMWSINTFSFAADSGVTYDSTTGKITVDEGANAWWTPYLVIPTMLISS